MAMSKTWEFKDAQALIAAMRAKVNQLGYEVTVGGSVLTKGSSTNDLDLFFVPLNEGPRQPIDLLLWIASKFGMGKTIIAAGGTRPNGIITPAGTLPTPSMAHKMRFDVGGRKVDVFVV